MTERDDAAPRRPIVTFGETMALLTSERPGPLAHAGELTLGMGGAESNVAIGLARLGCPVTWIGRLGDDSLGELVAREIRAEGVRSVTIVDQGAPTGFMIKERRTASIQRVHYYREGSAASRLAPDDIPDDVVQGAAVLHLTGITAALSASARDAIRASVAVARAAGVTVSFDLNFRASLWSRDAAREFYGEIIPLADIVFANTEEAGIVVGDRRDPVELARALGELGPRTVIVKLGAGGAVAVSAGEVYDQAAIAVTVVDTVGAGDAFAAGFLAEHAAGASVSSCLKLAVEVGAFVCTCPGDWEGLPRRKELALLGAGDPVAR